MYLIITGASGFIGQQIIPLLDAQGHRLLLVGRDAQKLANVYPNHQCCDYASLGNEGAGADLCLHLAVMNNDKEGSIDAFRNANVDLLKQVVDACKTASVPNLIYPSSLQTGRSDSHYSVTKKEADDYLKSINTPSVLRVSLPAVYGDGQFAGKLSILKRIPSMIREPVFQILKSLRPTVHSSRIVDFIVDSASNGSQKSPILSDRQEGNRAYHWAKRLIDISFAVAIIVFFIWLLIVVWLLVKFTSKGPGIFQQERVGKNGEVFTLYKFRTLIEYTRQTDTHEIPDSSFTPVGRILRKSKIDELPQIWNILKGEISLVGPRPSLPVQTKVIEERCKWGVQNVLPGITGYSQVRGIDMSTPGELAKSDHEYEAIKSLTLDLKIILRTFTGSLTGFKFN